MSYAKALESRKQRLGNVQLVVARTEPPVHVVTRPLKRRTVTQKPTANICYIDAEDVRIMDAANYCDQWELGHPGGIY